MSSEDRYWSRLQIEFERLKAKARCCSADERELVLLQLCDFEQVVKKARAKRVDQCGGDPTSGFSTENEVKNDSFY